MEGEGDTVKLEGKEGAGVWHDYILPERERERERERGMGKWKPAETHSLFCC